jgi:nucleoside-diphosphate kinase
MPQAHEQTLVIVKPDALQRGLVGEIIQRFEHKGLKLIAIKMMVLDTKLLDHHYQHHVGKPFYPNLVKFMSSTPCVVMIWQGLEAVSTVRRLCGITKSREAEMGSIRGDFGMSQQMNLIHASDTSQTARTEIARFFSDRSEIFDWERTLAEFLYGEDEK